MRFARGSPALLSKDPPRGDSSASACESSGSGIGRGMSGLTERLADENLVVCECPYPADECNVWI
jgi:hypothetical protein